MKPCRAEQCIECRTGREHMFHNTLFHSKPQGRDPLRFCSGAFTHLAAFVHMFPQRFRLIDGSLSFCYGRRHAVQRCNARISAPCAMSSPATAVLSWGSPPSNDEDTTTPQTHLAVKDRYCFSLPVIRYEDTQRSMTRPFRYQTSKNRTLAARGIITPDTRTQRRP